jgi:ribosomal subunit interface protein
VQVSISARHGHLSEKTQKKIHDKVEKLGRFSVRLTGVQVTVDLEYHDSVRVEVRAAAEHMPDFVASETADELFVALDVVVHKVEQQLRKRKEKRQTGHRQPGRKRAEVPLEPGSSAE